MEIREINDINIPSSSRIKVQYYLNVVCNVHTASLYYFFLFHFNLFLSVSFFKTISALCLYHFLYFISLLSLQWNYWEHN